MKLKHIVATGAVVAAIAMAACGKKNTTATTAPAAPTPAPVVAAPTPAPVAGAPTPPPVGGAPAPPAMATGQSLNTAAVLAQARATSETASPYAVNDGALTITDSSDATGPINAN